MALLGLMFSSFGQDFGWEHDNSELMENWNCFHSNGEIFLYYVNYNNNYYNGISQINSNGEILDLIELEITDGISHFSKIEANEYYLLQYQDMSFANTITIKVDFDNNIDTINIEGQILVDENLAEVQFRNGNVIDYYDYNLDYLRTDTIIIPNNTSAHSSSLGYLMARTNYYSGSVDDTIYLVDVISNEIIQHDSPINSGYGFRIVQDKIVETDHGNLKNIYNLNFELELELENMSFSDFAANESFFFFKGYNGNYIHRFNSENLDFVDSIQNYNNIRWSNSIGIADSALLIWSYNNIRLVDNNFFNKCTQPVLESFTSSISNNEITISWASDSIFGNRYLGLYEMTNVFDEYNLIDSLKLNNESYTYENERAKEMMLWITGAIHDKCGDTYYDINRSNIITNTIHLSAYQGVNTTNELIWNNYISHPSEYEYISFYLIYNSQDGFNFSVLDTVTGFYIDWETPNFKFTHLAPNTDENYYYVEAVMGNSSSNRSVGTKIMSNIGYVENEISTNIESLVDEMNFWSDGKNIYFKNELLEGYVFELISISGSKVIEINVNNSFNVISLNDIAIGTYIAKLSNLNSKGNSITKKIIVR